MDKGEIKAATIHELGLKFDDMLEAAHKEVARNEGATAACLAASKKVGELAVHVDKDMDEGLFADVDGPLAVAKAIKKYLVRVCGILETGAKSADNHRLVSQGRAMAFDQMVKNMKQLHDLELEKSRQKKEVIASGVSRVPQRPVGTPPPRSLKERRQAEAAAAAEAPKAPPKKRGRKPKAIKGD